MNRLLDSLSKAVITARYESRTRSSAFSRVLDSGSGIRIRFSAGVAACDTRYVPTGRVSSHGAVLGVLGPDGPCGDLIGSRMLETSQREFSRQQGPTLRRGSTPRDGCLWSEQRGCYRCNHPVVCAVILATGSRPGA